MIRQPLLSRYPASPVHSSDDSTQALTHVLSSLASLTDPESVTEVLGEYLGCEVTFMIAPQEAEPRDEQHEVVQHDGDALWVNVPLFFDRSQVGWLRAVRKQPSELELQLLVLAGRVTACILWEQSRAQRAWLRVLEGEEATADELAEAAQSLGWPPGTDVGVLAVYLAESPFQNGNALAEGDHTWHRCPLPLDRQRHLRGLSFCRGATLAMFVPLSTLEAAREAPALKKLAATVQAVLSSRQRGECAVGIGGATAELDRLPHLWRVASRALHWGIALHGRTAITSSESFGILGLLVDHVPSGLLAEMRGRMLGPLIEHDAKKGTAFCQTLQVFLNCDGNFGEAAKRLYVHENTLRHRIRRIQNTLPVDLADPYLRAAILLFLRLNGLGLAESPVLRAPRPV
ncbi:MAG: helix-turn-helix domain-containing protein [Bacillota bacterium]|nr:helix-turn-helix domain-containing protein [Bacillota bacterium]